MGIGVNFPISDDLKDILSEFNCSFNGTTLCNGTYETAVDINCNGDETTFYVTHDGSEQHLIENLIEMLDDFDPVDYALAGINSFSVDSLEDIEEHVKQARDMDRFCRSRDQNSLAGKLSEHCEKKYKSEN